MTDVSKETKEKAPKLRALEEFIATEAQMMGLGPYDTSFALLDLTARLLVTHDLPTELAPTMLQRRIDDYKKTKARDG